MKAISAAQLVTVALLSVSSAKADMYGDLNSVDRAFDSYSSEQLSKSKTFNLQPADASLVQAVYGMHLRIDDAQRANDVCGGAALQTNHQVNLIPVTKDMQAIGRANTGSGRWQDLMVATPVDAAHVSGEKCSEATVNTLIGAAASSNPNVDADLQSVAKSVKSHCGLELPPASFINEVLLKRRERNPANQQTDLDTVKGRLTNTQAILFVQKAMETNPNVMAGAKLLQDLVMPDAEVSVINDPATKSHYLVLKTQDGKTAMVSWKGLLTDQKSNVPYANGKALPQAEADQAIQQLHASLANSPAGFQDQSLGPLAAVCDDGHDCDVYQAKSDNGQNFLVLNSGPAVHYRSTTEYRYTGPAARAAQAKSKIDLKVATSETATIGGLNLPSVIGEVTDSRVFVGVHVGDGELGFKYGRTTVDTKSATGTVPTMPSQSRAAMIFTMPFN